MPVSDSREDSAMATPRINQAEEQALSRYLLASLSAGREGRGGERVSRPRPSVIARCVAENRRLSVILEDLRMTGGDQETGAISLEF